MSKQSSIEVTGKVVQELGNSNFKVTLDNMPEEQDGIICTISGRIRKNFIRIMAGDKVKIEMSPYDLTRGRIVLRIKEERAGSPGTSQKNSKNKSSINNKTKKKK